jgi:hypothetical protein
MSKKINDWFLSLGSKREANGLKGKNILIITSFYPMSASKWLKVKLFISDEIHLFIV